MRRIWTGLTAGLLMLGMVGVAQASIVTLIEQGSLWEYAPVSTDLWTNWNAAGYNSFNWNGANWATGSAAFGNYYSGGLPYKTYWRENTDLALQRTFSINGVLNAPITLNVASDNGFIVFINGVKVAKANAEGYTSYWEYTFNNLSASTFLSPGDNLIQVLAEDHGGATFFDLKLKGDVSPVPEPASMVLLGTGILGFLGFRRKLLGK